MRLTEKKMLKTYERVYERACERAQECSDNCMDPRYDTISRMMNESYRDGRIFITDALKAKLASVAPNDSFSMDEIVRYLDEINARMDEIGRTHENNN